MIIISRVTLPRAGVLLAQVTLIAGLVGCGQQTMSIMPCAASPTTIAGEGHGTTADEITLTQRKNNEVVVIHPGVRVQVELSDQGDTWVPWTSPDSSNSSVLQRLSVCRLSDATSATFVGVQAGQALITANAPAQCRSRPHPCGGVYDLGFTVTVNVLSG